MQQPAPFKLPKTKDIPNVAVLQIMVIIKGSKIRFVSTVIKFHINILYIDDVRHTTETDTYSRYNEKNTPYLISY